MYVQKKKHIANNNERGSRKKYKTKKNNKKHGVMIDAKLYIRYTEDICVHSKHQEHLKIMFNKLQPKRNTNCLKCL